MERSSDDPRIDPAALEQEWVALRAEQVAWRGEQKEWEEVRSQVEQGLSDLRCGCLSSPKRLRCPRGSEEFEAALREQLDIAVERQRSAEARLAESERRRDDLMADLQASEAANASRAGRRDQPTAGRARVGPGGTRSGGRAPSPDSSPNSPRRTRRVTRSRPRSKRSARSGMGSTKF